MNSPKPVPDEVSGTQTKPEVDLIKLEPAHETKIKPVETHKTEKADSPVSQKAVVLHLMNNGNLSINISL